MTFDSQLLLYLPVVVGVLSISLAILIFFTVWYRGKERLYSDVNYSDERSFLFLQGVASPFFKRLSSEIINCGYKVYKVNFCGGDSLFYNGRYSFAFGAELEELDVFLKEKYMAHNITDVVLFDDLRPVHKRAIEFFQDKDVNVYVFNDGYLRPSWVTLEKQGTNARSKYFGNPSSFWAKEPQEVFENTLSSYNTFGTRAIHDINYRLANALLYPIYKNYIPHRKASALVEYAGWATRLPSIKLYWFKKDNEFVEKIVSSKKPYYLFVLQLNDDLLLKNDSSFDDVHESIDFVISSFARSSCSDATLIIKNHPLDTGIANFRRVVESSSKKFGVAESVEFLESGNLPILLKNTSGTILVNSPTGISALYHGSPVVTIGEAIYDVPGLTHQSGLDSFWTNPEKPDQELFKSFRLNLVKEALIPGELYTNRGIDILVNKSVQKMKIKKWNSPKKSKKSKGFIDKLLTEI